MSKTIIFCNKTPQQQGIHVADSVDAAIRRTIDTEGHEYTDDPNDQPTKYGIIKPDLEACAHPGPLHSLTYNDAYCIYWLKYWIKPKLHFIGAVSMVVAEELFDTRVLMGPRHSVRWLQETINTWNWQRRYGDDLVVDGLAGPATANALKMVIDHRGYEAAIEAVMFALNASQWERIKVISDSDKSHREYTWGWLQNRAMTDVKLAWGIEE